MTHSFRGTHTHTYIRNLCHQFHQVVSLDLRYFVRFHYYILLFEFTCVAVAIVVVVDDCAVYAAASDYKALGECSGHVRSYVAFANVNVIFSETSRWTSDLTRHFDIGDCVLCLLRFYDSGVDLINVLIENGRHAATKQTKLITATAAADLNSVAVHRLSFLALTHLTFSFVHRMSAPVHTGFKRCRFSRFIGI